MSKKKRHIQLKPRGWTEAAVRAFHADKLEYFRIMAARSKKDREPERKE